LHDEEIAQVEVEAQVEHAAQVEVEVEGAGGGSCGKAAQETVRSRRRVQDKGEARSRSTTC
jgi:hypothetical protein